MYLKSRERLLVKRAEKLYYFIMIYVTEKPEETQKLGEEFAARLLNFKGDTAAVVALEGELGAGKTVFIQGLAKGLSLEAKIKSPTFVLMKIYALPAGGQVYHLDCYRLRDEQDLVALEMKEIMANPKNIVLIEWADRVAKALPEDCFKIHIDHIGENKRKISIE